METSFGSRVRRLGTTAMSSNAYALRPRLPRPISISVTWVPFALQVCRPSIPALFAAPSYGLASGVVGCLGGHLDVVRVALLEPGRRDPYEAALLLELRHIRRADIPHRRPQTAHELVRHRGERAPVGHLALDALGHQLVLGEHIVLEVAVLGV